MCVPLIRSTMSATTTTMKHLLDTFCVVLQGQPGNYSRHRDTSQGRFIHSPFPAVSSSMCVVAATYNHHYRGSNTPRQLSGRLIAYNTLQNKCNKISIITRLHSTLDPQVASQMTPCPSSQAASALRVHYGQVHVAWVEDELDPTRPDQLFAQPVCKQWNCYQVSLAAHAAICILFRNILNF